MYIRDHRDEFDVIIPDDRLWDQIGKTAPKVVKLSWKTIAIRVAAVIVIFIASYYFHDWMQENSVIIVQPGSNTEETESIRMLMEAEVFYSSHINNAKDEIFKLSGGNPKIIEEINYDLGELEDIFKELKNDLKENNDNEEVIEAMIQNYRLKLSILEDVLYQLKKSKIVKENENPQYEI